MLKKSCETKEKEREMALTEVPALMELSPIHREPLSANSAGIGVTYNMTLINVKIANSSLTFPQSRSNTTEQLLLFKSYTLCASKEKQG